MLFKNVIFAVFIIFIVIGFYTSTEFEFEFAQRIPVVSYIPWIPTSGAVTSLSEGHGRLFCIHKRLRNTSVWA